MKKIIGYGYRGFLFIYQDGYGEMNYLTSDFKRIWNTIKRNISNDKNYLKKIKEKYNSLCDNYKQFCLEYNWANLRKIDDNELLNIFKNCCWAQVNAGGVAHILDAVSIEAEKEFRKMLFEELENKKDFNKYFPILIAPSKLSFVIQEEKDLLKISKYPIGARKKLLQQHYKKYFWIQNSYAGPANLSIRSFQNRLRNLKSFNSDDYSKKKKLIKKLKLSKKLVMFIKLIDFCMVWQDERKANILKSISYLAYTLKEISERLNIRFNLLYHICALEAISLKSFSEINKLVDELKIRSKGAMVLMVTNKEYIISGKQFKIISNIYKKTFKAAKIGDEIIGLVANGGTAIGPVKICKTISDVSKVKKGDILVTGMTRPEFLPAIKNAAAIVTDEGGITSHAAIIARELGIPAVIGTRVATRVLRDGMTVEVKADHGLIKKL